VQVNSHTDIPSRKGFANPTKGPDMRNVFWRLLIWVAEILDRNLITEPEIDELYPPSTDPADGGRGWEVERTRPILRDLFATRAGAPPGFVQG
jgi:hypothetical protein